MDMNKEEHSSQDETKPIMETDAKKLDDPETQDGRTDKKIIPL